MELKALQSLDFTLKEIYRHIRTDESINERKLVISINNKIATCDFINYDLSQAKLLTPEIYRHDSNAVHYVSHWPGKKFEAIQSSVSMATTIFNLKGIYLDTVCLFDFMHRILNESKDIDNDFDEKRLYNVHFLESDLHFDFIPATNEYDFLSFTSL